MSRAGSVRRCRLTLRRQHARNSGRRHLAPKFALLPKLAAEHVSYGIAALPEFWQRETAVVGSAVAAGNHHTRSSRNRQGYFLRKKGTMPKLTHRRARLKKHRGAESRQAARVRLHLAHLEFNERDDAAERELIEVLDLTRKLEETRHCATEEAAVLHFFGSAVSFTTGPLVVSRLKLNLGRNTWYCGNCRGRERRSQESEGHTSLFNPPTVQARALKCSSDTEGLTPAASAAVA